MEAYINEREVYKKLIWHGIYYWVLNELSDYHYVVIYANGKPQYPFLLSVTDNVSAIETFPEGILVETLFVPKFRSIGTMQKLSGKIPEPFKKEGKVTEHIQLRLLETFGFLYVGDREYLLLQPADHRFELMSGGKVFLVTPNQVVASGKENNDEVIWAYGSPREVTVKGNYVIDDARTKPALVRFYETDNIPSIWVSEVEDKK